MRPGLRNRSPGGYGTVMIIRTLSVVLFALVGCGAQSMVVGGDDMSDTADGDTADTGTDTGTDTDTDTGTDTADTGEDTGTTDEPACVGDWVGTVTLTGENDRGEFELCTGEVKLSLDENNLKLAGSGTCEGEGGGDPGRPAPALTLAFDGKANESCELRADVTVIVTELGETIAEDRWEGSAGATDGRLDVEGELTTPPGPDGTIMTLPYVGSIVLER